MSSQEFDAIIIGGGPGGYVAAIRCAQLGMKTALVEKTHLGGICLNWGCIPTKALLRSAEILEYAKHATDFGLKALKPEVDFPKVIERSRGVASQLSQGIAHLMKKNKVTVFMGHGQLEGRQGDNHQITVTLEDQKTQTLLSKNIILATGARARELPDFAANGKTIWNYRHAMTPDQQPKSLVVLGSGAIGIEFASFYNTLGTHVTVVEMQDRILPVEDREISQLAQKSLEIQGITIHVNATVSESKATKSGIQLSLKTAQGEETLETDALLVAVGIQGNVENLNLEATKVHVERGQIKVNEWCQTHEPGIYAIGDVAGAPWLAHKASHEGVMVAEKIAGNPHVHPMRKDHIPGCTYSHPQVASVGMTEDKAKEAGYDIKVGRFPFLGNGKAIALGTTEGLVKTIFDKKTGAFLGAHMIGHEVTELIHSFALALTLEATEADLMATIFPHPTLSEMIHESTLNADGQALHI